MLRRMRKETSNQGIRVGSYEEVIIKVLVLSRHVDNKGNACASKDMPLPNPSQRVLMKSKGTRSLEGVLYPNSKVFGL